MSQRLCAVPECSSQAACKRWCWKHYMRQHRTGSLELQDQRKACSVEGCAAPVRTRGWCSTHYARFVRHGDVQAHLPIRFNREGGPACAVEDCGRENRGRYYCPMHAARNQRLGEPGEALPRQAERGQLRRIDANGYVLIAGRRSPTSRSNGVLEHRKVMEDHLGRPLLRTETVHHINGIRDDNRLENLELWSSSHPAGQRVEDKVAWAREILALYG